MTAAFKLREWEISEFQIQCSLVDCLNKFAAPNTLWFHCPNGEQRSPQAGRRLKRAGTKAGVADLIFLRAGSAPLFLEIKTSRGVQSTSQREFERQAIAAGAEYHVCRSLDAALQILWELKFLSRRLT